MKNLKNTLPIDDQLLKSLHSELKVHTKALGIAPGAAEIFIDRSLKAAVKSLKSRKVVTKADLTRAVSKELAKYHADLAYVFKNYGKII